MARLIGSLAIAVGLLGCSSSKGGGPYGAPADGGTGGADGSVAANDGATPPPSDASGTVPGDSGVRAVTCTAPPFVGFSATLTEQGPTGGAQPLPGATVGFSTCPGFKLTTDALGIASTQITQGIPVTPLYTAPGAIDALGAEISAVIDVQPAVTLVARSAAFAVPGITDGGDAPVLEIVIVAGGAPAGSPCWDVSGVTLVVTGHPEATVSYMGATWPADPTVAGTTSSVGPRVFIGGVQGASKVQVTGTKSGCSVSIANASQTGNFVLLPGSITIGTASVGN